MGKIISVGIDPSFTGTGIVILIDDQLYYSTTVTTDSKESILTRVGEIVADILDSLDKVLYRYKEGDKVIICVEGFSFASKGRAVFQIGYLGWKVREIIEGFCNFRGFTWIEVPPNNLKLYATGKGNCGKELIMLQVYKRWGQEFSDNNTADAFVLAKMGHSYIDKKEDLTEFQTRSMDAVRKVNN